MRPSRLSCAAAMSAVALAFAVPALAQETPTQNNAEMAAIFAADQAIRQNLTPDFFKDRAPEAALRIAYIQRDAGRKPQFVAQLRAVLKKYPKSSQSSQAHQELEKLGVRIGGGVDADS